jgi:REP element-mobilizing transposase RayT
VRGARQLSFDDHRRRSGRGGPRPGAGRPRKLHGVVHHVRRDPHPGRCPAHVTIKTRREVPSLRTRAFVREFKRSLREAAERGEFRVVHYSLQRDHVHLVVEAAGCQALGRGMKSIGSRLARAVNRVFRRSGPVLLGRYHVRALRTPKEVRNALGYVLLNARRHWTQSRGAAPPVQLDEASSACWFDGWKRWPRGPIPAETPEVATARTWLLIRGWRRHGLVDPLEVPGGGAAL